MKYFKRLEKYKASNVELSIKPLKAFSYGWWQFLGVVNGVIVFNDYNYSITTSAHQRKVKRLLRELGIDVGLVIRSHGGLQSDNNKVAMQAIEDSIRSQNVEKAEKIANLFSVELTQEHIQSIYDQMEIDICDKYLESSYQYYKKKAEKAWLYCSVGKLIYDKE